jgi:virginiamycin B lyase
MIRKTTMVALLAAGVAGCASQQNASLPMAKSFATLDRVGTDTRGKITFYTDRFGDPTPDGITAGPDGALWFTDPGNDVIGRVTVHGSYTLQQSVGEELSSGITVGPDKKLWFTLLGGGVGRMTTAGSFRLFHDPQGSFPQGITTGPDGALWFAQSDGTVGRVTTQGAFQHFTVAGGNAQLQGIVTGPDGNLWLTQFVVGSHLSNQVIRLSPNGQYTAFTVGSGPAWICVGPDNALWFAEEGANAIGRLATDGTFTEFPTGQKYGEPSGIATGPDGALWFTDFDGRFEIGRLTTSGKMRFFASSSAAGELLQIAPGPKSAMWFTSSQGGSGVGRVTTR